MKNNARVLSVLAVVVGLTAGLGVGLVSPAFAAAPGTGGQGAGLDWGWIVAAVVVVAALAVVALVLRRAGARRGRHR